MQAIINAMPNPVMLKDRFHRLVLVNDAFCELLNQTREDLLGEEGEKIPDDQRDVFWEIDDEVFRTGLPNENEEVLTDGTGSLRVVLTRKCLVTLPTQSGQQQFLLGVITDVTRFRESEARAQYLAEHDALTGLANRAQLNDRLEAEIKAAGGTDNKLALLLLDLDGFKEVNDTQGHHVGDELLKIIAKRLAGLVRAGDVVARYGGDEFCILQTSAARSADLAEKIITTVGRPVSVNGRQLCVTASVGIAIFPEDGTTSDELLQSADSALYHVKRSGRAGFYKYQPEVHLDQSQRWNVEHELREALGTDQLSLEFQPLASAQDGQLRGFEALCRWQHPVYGEISPDVFIPVAEATGLIKELGAWVLREACRQAARWEWPVQVAVNVSPCQLEDHNFPDMVFDALREANLPPHRLELEVTESALIGQSDTTTEALSVLRAKGIGFALDDFGAGWSSLSTLRKFKFDRLKIDKSFIWQIESDPRSVAIVRAVLGLAKSLGVPVTAEGIEDQAQLLALRNMGCTEVQGFHLGRPNSVASLPAQEPWQAINETNEKPS
ncbi:putative bifunctional diguanylate cyclase/phosphodiesterase [Pseudorhodoplanes sinuspersici]|nr:EAL domain-containing protein [Pseudorhodoplanes sinuspersici]RKE70827.1 PAS domain S-box-containing protein/diguanylate cyclase (GGDEF)-like protein [Pseudorhodoplanes sinuspersici]